MAAPNVIVNPNEILDENQMWNEVLRLNEICDNEQINIIKWLARRRLLRNSSFCEECQVINFKILVCNDYIKKDGYLIK